MDHVWGSIYDNASHMMDMLDCQPTISLIRTDRWCQLTCLFRHNELLNYDTDWADQVQVGLG
jgi:hypothetical protein